MICYLDTAGVVWLAEANLTKLSQKVLSLIQAADLRISPTTFMESWRRARWPA